MQINEKVIFLTGGSSGIGYKCALAYAREGAHMAVISNNGEQLEQVVNEIGSKCHIGIFCDVSDNDQVRNAIEVVMQRFGRIDAIHNNAGIVTPSATLHETSLEEWQLLMNTNLKSVYLTTRYGFEHLKKTRGSILCTSSLVGSIGQQDHAAYAATKGGIDALTKSMALDYAKYHIRVNAVCPAWVWTPAVEKWVAEQSGLDNIKNYINNIHPLGYCPEGDVVADACVFLLSEKARFITGCTLPVSGGAELGYRLNMAESR